MGQLITGVKSLISDINGLSGYLLAVAALGTLTMAVLQVIKDLTPARRWFQRYRMLNFLNEHVEVAAKNLGLKACAASAEKEILLLATDSDAGAFYSLEIEKLCGQWNAAVQIVIDSPKEYEDFFSCVAARASQKDFEIVLGRDFPETLPSHEEARLPLDEQKRRLDQRHLFVGARTRVTHQIQRAIDAFQIDTSFRWKWLLQLASFFISFLFALMALNRSLVSQGNALVSAAIAGFLAPVARDLFATLQKLRS
jgi:hypothetical protein